MENGDETKGVEQVHETESGDGLCGDGDRQKMVHHLEGKPQTQQKIQRMSSLGVEEKLMQELCPFHYARDSNLKEGWKLYGYCKSQLGVNLQEIIFIQHLMHNNCIASYLIVAIIVYLLFGNM